MSSLPDPPSGPDAAPDVPVRVRLIGRDFTLRVRPGDEARTRESVAYVDAKLTAFRKAHPMQNETTAALIVALALGDELLDARRAADDDAEAQSHVTDALLGLDLHLAAALSPRRSGAPRSPSAGDVDPLAEGAEDDPDDDLGTEDFDGAPDTGEDDQDEADGPKEAHFGAASASEGIGTAPGAAPGEGRAEEPARERPV